MFLESKTTNGQTMSNNACLFSISTLIIPCQHPFCHFPHQAAKNWFCLQIGYPKVSCLIKVFPQLPRHKDHVWDNIQSHTVACASCRKPCPTISQEHLVGGWPTPLKNTSQLGWLFPIYGIKHVPNHQSVMVYISNSSHRLEKFWYLESPVIHIVI